MPSRFYMEAPTRILCFPSAPPNGCRYTEEREWGETRGWESRRKGGGRCTGGGKIGGRQGDLKVIGLETLHDILQIKN